MDLNDYNFNPQQKGFFENLGSHIIDFIQTLVVFGAIFALIYLFVAQFHKVFGSSMVPTMHSGDFLITEKISYKFREPKWGDIIVLKNPKEESEDFIKRIIAVPSDTIKIEDNAIFINGGIIKESYLPPGTVTSGKTFLPEKTTINLGPNQYFVMGDNRTHSSDSREWGPITKEEIVGRAFFRYWPPKDIGFLTNK